MNDLTAIILTYNEEIHIKRCIESIKQLADKVFIIDSFSSDSTTKIAESEGATVVRRVFKNQADQFQWGLENLDISTRWVMKLDADEYLEDELQDELKRAISESAENVGGFYMRRKVFFMGQWIRHGGFYPHTLLRIWRTGKGRVEQRWMDEHIVIPSTSKTIMLQGHLVDDNLKGLTFWIEKHNRYASREMADILVHKYFLSQGDFGVREMRDDPQARWKRALKIDVYLKLPVGLRAVLYFFYRYFIKLGFLDGSKGFFWHFLQGLWYRLLVDLKIMEIEHRTKGDSQAMLAILKDEYGIEL